MCICMYIYVYSPSVFWDLIFYKGFYSGEAIHANDLRWCRGYFWADLSQYDMLVRTWMYLSWIFILRSPGICIILVHLLIKFKLHFLPESVAVVSLGKFFFFFLLQSSKLYFLHWKGPILHPVFHPPSVIPICPVPFSCDCWCTITHFYLSLRANFAACFLPYHFHCPVGSFSVFWKLSSLSECQGLLLTVVDH